VFIAIKKADGFAVRISIIAEYTNGISNESYEPYRPMTNASEGIVSSVRNDSE
jgi:hypothetical protein